MKPLFIVPWLSLIYISTTKIRHTVIQGTTLDSAVITHTLDGLVNEWPADRFTTHKETSVRYAADNNSVDLYLAISLPSPAWQAKIMKAGMSLYIDLNGKKRESRGVEFPIVNEDSPDLPPGKNTDINTIRSMMILNLIKLKLFGFSDNAPPYQELTMPGSVNVAYGWDSAQVMHIEYRIPISVFGDPATLNQKNISIGWKLHAVPTPPQSPAVASTSTRVVGVRPGTRPSGASNTTTPATNTRNAMNEEQRFWGKYVIVISN
ncbi:MAG: hypothetical protein ACHQFX_01460 [Chitinophagales bacterium]